MNKDIQTLIEREAEALEELYRAIEDHKVWRKSKRGRSYLRKHPISKKEMLQTLKDRL